MVRELRTPPTVESAPVSVLVLPTCNGSSCYKDEYLSFRFISSIIRVIMHVGRFLRTYVPAAVVTLLAVATVGCGSLYWDSVSPRYTTDTAPYRMLWMPQDAPLNAVRGFGANSVYAVGAYGTILHSIDGEHWTHQSSQTQADLNAIFGTPDGKKLWIVGDGGTILHSTDGEHWSAQSSSSPHSLHSIFGAQDGNQLWAVGDFTILHSTDGEHWTARGHNVPDSLHSIFGTPDSKELWVVGNAGMILHSTDGEHWAAQFSGTKATLLSVFGTPDGKQLWAVGDAGTIIHSMDGEHWAAQSPNVRFNMRSISVAPDGKQLWAVGGSVAAADGPSIPDWFVAGCGVPAVGSSGLWLRHESVIFIGTTCGTRLPLGW